MSGNDQDKRWQEFQVHHASEIWVIYVELVVVGLRSVDSSLVWYVLHANLEFLFFYVCQMHQKHRKHGRMLCVLEKSSGYTVTTQPYENTEGKFED